MADQPKYPDVEVDVALEGQEANAFFVTWKVRNALLHAGVAERTADEYVDAATAGSYADVLATTREWVTVR